jgi:hypothetical protein
MQCVYAMIGLRYSYAYLVEVAPLALLRCVVEIFEFRILIFLES